MEEKIHVEFTGEEFDLILKYMDSGKFETVQEAILHAVRCGGASIELRRGVGES